MRKIISSLPALKPVEIMDVATGELVTNKDLTSSLDSLMNYALPETKRLWDMHREVLSESLLDPRGITAPAEWARQRGISSSAMELPREVRAKSRVDKIVQHKLITESASYVRNPNPRKQEMTFSKKFNLGAVDKQMASLSWDGSELTLLTYVWDRQYLLTFRIPDYVLSRDIVKFSLPAIQWMKGGYVFIFTVQERPAVRPKGGQTAGVDLGRRLPYVLAIVNSEGDRAAHYVASPRLIQLNNKRERLLVEAAHLLRKTSAYDALGLDSDVLRENRALVKSKASRLGKTVAAQTGTEIADRLSKHDTNLLHVEDLTWVHGARYGSRWVHSRQQDAIIHTAAREGIRTKKVSPRNSSRNCHGCGSDLSTAGRSVHCSSCRTSLDRDFNAALNIASLRHLRFPPAQRTTGDDSTASEVVAVRPSSSSTAPERDVVVGFVT